MGCPERLWSLLLWRHSRPTWTPTCATWSREPALAGGVDSMIARGPFQPLQFCDSVIPTPPACRQHRRVLCTHAEPCEPALSPASPCFWLCHGTEGALKAELQALAPGSWFSLHGSVLLSGASSYARHRPWSLRRWVRSRDPAPLKAFTETGS